MNTKLGAILLVSLVALAVAIPMVLGSDVGTTASVNNKAPVVAISTISPDPATPVETVTVSGTLSDPNGIEDVTSLTYVVKMPDTSTYTSGSATVQASWSFGFSVGMDAPPGNYTVEVTASDGSLSDDDSKTFVVNEVVAFSIDFNAINYGAIDPGSYSTVTGDTTMQTPVGANPPTIQNDGNDDMDVQMLIDDNVANPETLFEGNTAATVGTVGPQTLGETAYTFDVDIAAASTAKIDSTLTVPTGTLDGSYSGTLTVTGVSG